MIKNNKVIFQGNGDTKYYNNLDSEELAMVTKALYTKQALLVGEHIIVGQDGISREEFY